MTTIDLVPHRTVKSAERNTLEADAARLTAAMSDMIRVVQFRDRDRACCYDISVTQCYALEAVVDGSGLTVNELAAHLYLDKSTTSRVANGLVQKGLITRRRDPATGGWFSSTRPRRAGGSTNGSTPISWRSTSSCWRTSIPRAGERWRSS